MVAKTVRHFPYLDLHDEAFEELTFLLARLEEPDLVRPKAPDLGLDGVVLGKGDAPAPRGFQSKHFTTGSPSWLQCRKSLNDAIANYNVKHVTFTFPRDLTGKQIKKFNQELADRYPEVKVDFWGASELTARLLTSDESERIARHVFGVDEYERMSRLIRAGQDLDTAGQAISVLGATGNLFSDDPYFDYRIGTRPASVPDSPPAASVVMRLEVGDEHGVHSIDAHARPAALAADRLPKGTMHLAGEEAIRRFQEFLRVGGELELEHVRMEWEQQPKHIAKLLGSEVDEASVVLRSEPVLQPRPIRIQFQTTTGEVSLDFDTQPTAPPPGWDFALVGQRGGTTMQMTLRRRGEMNVHWSWQMGASHSADEHLVGLKILEAAAGEGDVRIIDLQSGKTLAVAASPEKPLDETIEILKRVLEDIVALESWLGVKIDVPEEITGPDANAVRWAVELIKGVESTWNDINFILARDPGEEPFSEAGIVQVRRSLLLDLFGQQYELGEEATYVTGAKLVSTEQVPDGHKFVLQPATPDAKMLTRLERAGPADAVDQRPARSTSPAPL